MMKINQNFKTTKYNWELFKYNKNRQLTTKKMMLTITAFFVSLLLGSMFILTQNINPFDALNIMFTEGWKNMFNRNGVLVEMSILALSALSFIIAQRSGMFNVAVTGQLWGGAVFAYLIGQHMQNVPIVLGQILMIFFAASFGIVTGSLITWLKTKFNVHEVVTSILFNFLVFFVGWFLVQEFLTSETGSITSIELGNNLRLFDANTNSAWIPAVILMLIVLFGTWFLFKFTKTGWKITAVGLSESAASYSGYNVNLTKSLSMSVSGAIAGILGLVVYTGLFQSIQIPTNNNLPGFGFDGIAIGLLALWNPIGIGFFSFIVGILNAGSPFLSLIGSTPIFMDLILGLIIYGSAIISGLIIYKPWLWILKKTKGEREFKGYTAYIDFISTKIDESQTKLYDYKKYYINLFKKNISNHKNLIGSFKENYYQYKIKQSNIIDNYFKFKNEQKKIIKIAIKQNSSSVKLKEH